MTTHPCADCGKPTDEAYDLCANCEENAINEKSDYFANTLGGYVDDGGEFHVFNDTPEPKRKPINAVWFALGFAFVFNTLFLISDGTPLAYLFAIPALLSSWLAIGQMILFVLKHATAR